MAISKGSSSLTRIPGMPVRVVENKARIVHGSGSFHYWNRVHGTGSQTFKVSVSSTRRDPASKPKSLHCRLKVGRQRPSQRFFAAVRSCTRIQRVSCDFRHSRCCGEGKVPDRKSDNPSPHGRINGIRFCPSPKPRISHGCLPSPALACAGGARAAQSAPHASSHPRRPTPPHGGNPGSRGARN